MLSIDLVLEQEYILDYSGIAEQNTVLTLFFSFVPGPGGGGGWVGDLGQYLRVCNETWQPGNACDTLQSIRCTT